MRYPEGHKEAVRARIVKTAAKVLRKGGIDAIGIPALMKKVGLTHGGFYVHFAGKDELVADAVESAAAATTAGAFADENTLEQTLARYLSLGHVQHPEEGCVLAALGSEGRTQPATVRRSFATTARGFLRNVERKLDPKSPPAKLSDEALALAARMIGAIVLARLVDDEALAERILAAARRI